jgi:GDPmannose 4,6-dehydratase
MIGGRPAATPVGGRRGTAIVTGAEGQDGHYLVALLLADGCIVHATVLDTAGADDLGRLPGAEHLNVHPLDVTDHGATMDLIAAIQPDELYNLAGDSSVARSFADPARTWRTNADVS